MAAIAGLVPLAGLADFQGRLKSLTGGKGAYSSTFAHHAPVPGGVQQQLASDFRGVELDD
jgi:elongation factor G